MRELVDWLAWSCDRKGGEDVADGEAAGKPIEVTDFLAGCPQRRRPSSSRECMPAEAVAFESLNADIACAPRRRGH